MRSFAFFACLAVRLAASSSMSKVDHVPFAAHEPRQFHEIFPESLIGAWPYNLLMPMREDEYRGILAQLSSGIETLSLSFGINDDVLLIIFSSGDQMVVLPQLGSAFRLNKAYTNLWIDVENRKMLVYNMTRGMVMYWGGNEVTEFPLSDFQQVNQFASPGFPSHTDGKPMWFINERFDVQYLTQDFFRIPIRGKTAQECLADPSRQFQPKWKRLSKSHPMNQDSRR